LISKNKPNETIFPRDDCLKYNNEIKKIQINKIVIQDVLKYKDILKEIHRAHWFSAARQRIKLQSITSAPQCAYLLNLRPSLDQNVIPRKPLNENTNHTKTKTGFTNI